MPSGSSAKGGPGAVIIFGIRNCDTMKKARAWLEGKEIAYRFHDYRTDGLERGTLEAWVRELGWEALLNRSGTTFRKLPESERAAVTESRAVTLMLDQPSMIRRPVLQAAGRLLVGFSPETYARVLR
jgi:arsenate reductase